MYLDGLRTALRPNSYLQSLMYAQRTVRAYLFIQTLINVVAVFVLQFRHLRLICS